MPGTIKTAINGHIVSLHKVPVAIKQALLGGLIPNFVQRSLVNLAKSYVRIIKYGKRNIGFTFTAHNFFTILVLYKTGAHPINRRIGREQHSWRLKRFVGSPTETGKQHLDSPFGNLRNFVYHSNGIFGRTKTFEIWVAGDIRHFFHDNN